MTTILVLALTAAALQQPHPPARRLAEPVTRSPANLAPSPNGYVPPPDPVPKTRYDTTIAAIVAVGRAVADVRAELDRFHQRAGSGASGEVLESSQAIMARCQDLTTASRNAGRAICRSCITRASQPAFDNYRAFMPTLAQLGTHCLTTFQRLRHREPEAAVAAIRREARPISDFMVSGLRQYEARLTPVRQALSGASPRRTP